MELDASQSLASIQCKSDRRGRGQRVDETVHFLLLVSRRFPTEVLVGLLGGPQLTTSPLAHLQNINILFLGTVIYYFCIENIQDKKVHIKILSHAQH